MTGIDRKGFEKVEFLGHESRESWFVHNVIFFLPAIPSPPFLERQLSFIWEECFYPTLRDPGESVNHVVPQIPPWKWTQESEEQVRMCPPFTWSE